MLADVAAHSGWTKDRLLTWNCSLTPSQRRASLAPALRLAADKRAMPTARPAGGGQRQDGNGRAWSAESSGGGAAERLNVHFVSQDDHLVTDGEQGLQ